MTSKPVSRAVSDAGQDDIVVPFLVEPLSTRGHRALDHHDVYDTHQPDERER